jgi:hypothetical protein
MIPITETTDHDQGPPPLHVGDVGHLARVLIDGSRWAMMSPGDLIAAYTVEEDVGHDPR